MTKEQEQEAFYRELMRRREIMRRYLGFPS